MKAKRQEMPQPVARLETHAAISSGSAGMPLAAYARFLAAAIDLESSLDERVAEAEAACAQGENALYDLMAGLAADIESLKGAVERGERPDLDQLIDANLRAEASIKQNDAETRKVIARIRKILKKSDPIFQRKIQPLFARYDLHVAEFLNALTGVRWDLMALRAAANTSERGPIYASSDDLKAYLASTEG